KKNLFKQIISFLKVGSPSPLAEPPMPPNGSVWAKLLRMVEDTDDVELSCDEVFALLDRFAELDVSSENAARLLPLVWKHLDRCRDCREEYAGLVKIIEAAADTGG
ncbi:MAG: hypothetical protein ACWGO1_16010, partial [Anaerolineales bacterium]